MTIDVQFRSALDTDLVLLREFEQGVIAAERPFSLNLKGDPIQYYDLEAMLASDDCEILVGEAPSQDSQIVACGYARLERSSDFYSHTHNVYLGFMYVLPEFRGQGISGQLLNALMDWGKNNDAGEARLDVYSLNESAIRAYEKAGFKSLLLNMRRSL